MRKDRRKKQLLLPWLSAAVVLTALLLAACGRSTGDTASGTGTERPTDTTGTDRESGTVTENRTETATGAHPDTGTASAAGTETQTDPRTAEEIFWDTLTAEEIFWDTLTGEDTLRGRGRRLARLTAPDDCPIAQGGWFDGRFWYQFFIDKDTGSNEQNNRVRLVKYDTATQETVRISDLLPLNHANDLTYDSRRGLLVAVHNKPNRELVSFLDPETLTVTETVTLPCKIFSLAYSPERDMYVAGIAGGQTFCLFDAGFRQVSGVFTPTPDTAGYVTQGCACDARYIYFVLYAQNVVTVYDWDGNHVRTLPVIVSGEPENLVQAGGCLYIGSATVGGAELTRIGLQIR